MIKSPATTGDEKTVAPVRNIHFSVPVARSTAWTRPAASPKYTRPSATDGDDQTGTSAPKRQRSVPDESSACAKCASELPAKTMWSLTAGDVMIHEIL